MPDDPSELAAGYWALRHDAAAVHIERDLVVVDGVDAETFLQGQLSQDVTTLAVTGPAWSFLLQPTGKVEAWVRVARLGADRFVLDVDAGFGPAVVRRLDRFKLRVNVEITQLVDWHAITVRGPNLAGAGLDAMNAELVVPDDWPGSPGAVAFGPNVEPPPDVVVAPPAALEALRIECGVPRLGSELTESTIPAEAGPWVLEASVSFTKGCYTGQELVARIDSRGGNVPRHLCAMVFGAEASVEPGAQIVLDRKTVGTITSVAWSPAADATVALASVARGVEPSASVMVAAGAGEVSATVLSLPVPVTS